MSEFYESKVSIIIPAYNVHDYIFRAIESSMSQTHKNIEIIIVDDGSSDGTWEIIDSFQKKDKRIIAHRQRNSGVSSARNKAISLSKGEYLLFLDSDDWLEPQAVKVLLEIQNRTFNKLVVTDCFYAYFDYKKNIYKEKAEKEAGDIVFEQLDALAQISGIKYKLRSACYKLFSMQVIREHSIRFNQSIRHGEDGLFVFEYLHFVDGFTYTNEPLWNILERPGSATTGAYNHSWMTAIDAVEKMIDMTEDDILLEKLKVYLVNRALTVEHGALEVKELPYDDIKEIREKLRIYRKLYLHKTTNAKRKVYYMLMTYVPVKLLNMYFLGRR